MGGQTHKLDSSGHGKQRRLFNWVAMSLCFIHILKRKDNFKYMYIPLFILWNAYNCNFTFNTYHLLTQIGILKRYQLIFEIMWLIWTNAHIESIPLNLFISWNYFNIISPLIQTYANKNSQKLSADIWLYIIMWLLWIHLHTESELSQFRNANKRTRC